MPRRNQNRTSNPTARNDAPDILSKLYTVLGENTENQVNYLALAATIGVKPARLSMLIPDLQESGVMVRRYEARYNDKGSIAGKKSFWRLPFPEATGQKMLKAFFATHPVVTWKEYRGVKSVKADAVIAPETAKFEVITPEVATKVYAEQFEPPVAIATRPSEETRAIAGPERTGPFESLRADRKDEAAALVEAARQYADRQNVVRRAFEEMEKLGVKVNWSHVADAVEVIPDARLDIVKDLLPYITTLEKRGDRLATDNAELRERIKASTVLQRENDQLREQNKRLIAQKVGATTLAASRS